MKNNSCDNTLCLISDGEVRLLPDGGGGNLILCRACYQHEINFRGYRNRNLEAGEQFPTPEWKALEVYGPGVNVEHEDFPMEEWKYAVACGDTSIGYVEWVKHQEEVERCEPSN